MVVLLGKEWPSKDLSGEEKKKKSRKKIRKIRNDVTMLLYADDTVLLGYSWIDVQLLDKYYENKLLKVNATKSKIIPFH